MFLLHIIRIRTFDTNNGEVPMYLKFPGHNFSYM